MSGLTRRDFSLSSPLWRRSCRFLLALVWLAGLGLGGAAGTRADVVSLMRGAVGAPLSIVGTLCVSVLPFLFSALAVFCSRPGWLLVIGLGKGFLLGFACVGLTLAFPGAGWLVRGLVLWGEWLLVPALYGFWLRHLSGERPLDGWALVLICAAALVGSVYYRLIAPFLAGLLEAL